ncbi:MAG: alkyl/aryl-sulfatase [Ardenticatenaceae bacterium]
MEPNEMISSNNKARRHEPTSYTLEANLKLAQTLNFDDRQDFEDANRGYLGGGDLDQIPEGAKRPAWKWSEYRTFLDSNPDTPAPASVNPSLWRQSQLTMISGLFEVVPGRIWQVRNYDLANMTFIESDECIIVVDVLTSQPTAKAAIDLFYEKTGTTKKVEWIIYTHCHVDHYGGIKGILEHEQASDDIKIVAPEGFLEHALAENVTAGNVMSRRAMYMYGSLLPKHPKGQVGVGLGMATPRGSVGLIEPTMIIRPNNDNFVRKNIGGLRFVFQLVPGSEAPAEMHFYMPRFNALCTAENAVHTLHNLYTLRGAKVRDAKAWSDYLSETIERWGGKAQVLFGVHHWPVWNEDGQNKIVPYLKKQRDTYKYIHDQTLRLANHGYNMDEIAEIIVAEGLPEGLHTNWATRGYYGSLSHNVKAVYAFYLGWYDGNPATLHPLPRVEASKKYVEYMGGADNILANAQTDYDNGEYRWVAQVVNHVIYADPNNKQARKLQADALEQLGYQAESGPWRNVYLAAAQSLRLPPRMPLPTTEASTVTPETISAMPTDMLFDYMAVRLNGFEAKHVEPMTLIWTFTDTREKYLMTLENSVLSQKEWERSDKEADATITLIRETLNDLMLGKTTVEEAIASGDMCIAGNSLKVETLFELMDSFTVWFNLVTPV